MNRKYCYGTDCDDERCTCHDEEIKEETDLDFARMDFNKAVKELNIAIDKVVVSNKQKTEAIQRATVYITEIITTLK